MDMVDGDVRVVPIKNHFFGESITVTGLITGGDLINSLNGISPGSDLLISSAMLRHDEPIFLDNATVADVEKALKVNVIPVANDGFELLDALLN